MPRQLEINCDLGEGEVLPITEALMRRIDRANIACGGHAGDEASLRACLELAHHHGVHAGLHPGLPDRQGFGRSTRQPLTRDELIQLLDDQVGPAVEIAKNVGVPPVHVKLHGALYHQVDSDPALAEAYLDHVQIKWPGLAVIARAGGAVSARTDRSAPRVLREAFLDRRYQPDGTLVPRTEPGAHVTDPFEVAERYRNLVESGGLFASDRSWIVLNPETLCIHGDSPDALTFLDHLRGAAPRRLG